MTVSDAVRCTRDKAAFLMDDAVNEFVAKARRGRWICIWYTCLLCTSKRKRTVISLTESFYSSGRNFACKPGACCGSGKTWRMQSASFDVMNKYFGISQMPVAGSTYWNIRARTYSGGSGIRMPKGLQTMRNLAKNHGMDDEMFRGRKKCRY